MKRNQRLARTYLRAKVADASLAEPEAIENRESRWVGEGGE
jgi:hypothetical protein